ncbi:MAG: hypothetical protein GY870_21455, partial [archaeon]|nr:hypothetical protein [archaeon]
ETKTFLKNNKEGINKGNIKLGVFVVGMFTLVDYNKQKEDNIKTGIIEEMGVNVTLYDAFGPVVDFSPDAKIGKTTKLIMKAAGKGIENDTDIKIDFEGYNDLRDWDKIKEFAENFGDLVLK